MNKHQAASIPDLVQQEVGQHMEEFGYEPSEAPDGPDDRDDPLDDARGSEDLAKDPGGEEVEMIEVIDPKTGETVMIPKADSSFIALAVLKPESTKVHQNLLRSRLSCGKQPRKLSASRRSNAGSLKRQGESCWLKSQSTKPLLHRLTASSEIRNRVLFR